MAMNFKDWPWPLQALFYVGLAVVLVLVGFYVPGLPLQKVRSQLETAQATLKPLDAEVARFARLQATQSRIAIANGRAPEATCNASDDCSGREADGSIHFDASKCGNGSGRIDSFLDGRADSYQAILFRNAIRRSRLTVLTTRFWISSPGWGGYLES